MTLRRYKRSTGNAGGRKPPFRRYSSPSPRPSKSIIILAGLAALSAAIGLSGKHDDEGEKAAAQTLMSSEPDYGETPVSKRAAASVYYRYCDDARAAGAAPINRGEPGYRDELDRDGDGVACEPYP